jgi:hypothetical protein
VAGLALAVDDRGDQIARDHEEDIDTHEAAGETGNAEVEQHHGQDGHGAQAVDVTSIGKMIHNIPCQRSCQEQRLSKTDLNR